jgi:alkylhydroperoxidase family enzyme
MPEEATNPVPTAPVADAPAAPAAEPASAPPATTLSVEDLQKELSKVRQEAADHRIKAKTAAEEAQKDLTDKLAVALGLKPDAAADPAALTASLTEAQQKANQAARELAIFKAASATGADPSRLLDSNSFMSSVAGLDPSDGAAVSAAIQAALAANPNLKAVQAAAASGTELGGSGETGQITEAQLAQMSPEAIVEAHQKGLLRNLLA